MKELPVINQIDPLHRQAEKDISDDGLSPMSPPDAFNPPARAYVPYEEMHPYLQGLMDEHKVCLNELTEFEKALLILQKEGVTREVDKALRDFYAFFDEKIRVHNLKEEQHLFPILKPKLIQSGEHGKGPEPTTGVDVMTEDHAEALQMAALSFNFFALASRLPDPASRAIVLDTALEQAKSLVELLRLHIFREDNVIFPQAHLLLNSSEFDFKA